jgi:hypothetical protein
LTCRGRSSAVIGKGLDEWPGERWLDIRRTKGCDAVEPDNVDGYNRMLARLAHERGLGVALKNDLGQVENLVADFDFAVNEECVAYDECQELMPLITAPREPCR